MGIKTYDPKEVQVILGGVPMSGLPDGTAVSLEWDDDAFTKTVGIDGEVSRSKNNNKCATLKFTLAQTSKSNDILSAFAIADEASNSGVAPFMLKETGSGSTLVAAEAAWIQGWPTVVYAKGIEGREWTIALAQCGRFVGGNLDT